MVRVKKQSEGKKSVTTYIGQITGSATTRDTPLDEWSHREIVTKPKGSRTSGALFLWLTHKMTHTHEREN